MKNFSYIRPATLDSALRELSGEEQRDVLAGGTTMVDLMKLGVVSPDRLVDITGIESLEHFAATNTLPLLPRDTLCLRQTQARLGVRSATGWKD